ncbi:Smr/MutS family protein [Brevundimonas sp. SORGH_AS_0993]|uniref:Smr/MutS family protein n=1 Tax=Brevundimonas sp. SORGH_AS_0993 TaxID=3041794 RepID=UPI002784F430|nr:Smr/MutS family protein [Brevundimonas sp. SORGH_AS_0993]MDQ1154674.1 DNA-nicking Smr family endonuclease [Brevundimonas sp. SORGH_AS_0993]
MKRKGAGRDDNGLTPEDRRIWGRVAGSVTPPRLRKADRIAAKGPALDLDPSAPPAAVAKPTARPTTKRAPPTPSAPIKTVLPGLPRARNAPEDLEPRRKQRIARERDPIEARIDLHGFGRFEAEDQLRGFLTACQARGLRAVLVITGQGRRGGGVIRASFAEWMQAPALRAVVSGYTVAHQRHGGDGAFYVTLRRRG